VAESPPLHFLRPHRQLNQVERWKLERHPLEVYEAVVNRYSKEGPEAIHAVPGEQERLKWVGVYPQRRDEEGSDGDEAFMLRIKVPGGRLTAEQARVIGEVADEFGRGPEPNPLFGDGYADITTRQDIQLHWISIQEMPEIWRRLEEVGVTTIQGCGDGPRNVVSCPVAGIDGDEVLDALPVARAVSDFFTGNRRYANLPRKFKISIAGCREDCAQGEINDIGMWPARLADGPVGFNVLVGGGLSDGPRLASDIDVFCSADDAVEIARAIAQLYGELGNRENRGICRMRYLVQELGPERFRSELEARAKVALTPAGEPLTRRYRGDHLGVHRQKQHGRFYVGCNVTVGRMVGKDMVEAARLAREYGSDEIRLANDQNLIFVGVRGERVDDLLAEELLKKHTPFPRAFERGAVACTGNEFCRFAVVETKARAVHIARWLDENVPLDGEDPIRIHFSGCSASCAQPQIADIGLRGETAHRDGAIHEAADVALGGSLGTDAELADFVESALPLDEMPRAIAGLARQYLDQRVGDERFHEWCRRMPDEVLRAALSAPRASAPAST